MKESVVFLTKNSNSYLYSAQSLLSLLIHPELRKAYDKSANVDPYYLKKYEYLEKYGLFKEAENTDFETSFDESIIKKNISQVRQIVFETTDHCNLHCSYCSLGELYKIGKTNHKNINTDFAINFLKYIFNIKPAKSKLIIGFFGGEPLINIDFIKKVIEETKQLNCKKGLELEFNITTNASLIHKHIKFLIDNNFILLISLDGNKKGHSYRSYIKNNKNSFNDVIKNIDMIQQYYPKYFDKNISFNAVLNNRNSVKEIYHFIYNRYHKIPRISQLNTTDITPNKKSFFNNIFRNKIMSEKEFEKEETALLPIVRKELTSYKELSNFLNNYSVNFYISNLINLLNNNIIPYPTGTCLPFDRKIFLNTNHDILPCEKVYYKYAMGKVNNNITFHISNIINEYNFYYSNIKKTCQHCYASKNCKICLLCLDNLDKLGTDEFICPGFQDKEHFKNRLNKIFSFLEKHPSDYFQIIDNKMI